MQHNEAPFWWLSSGTSKMGQNIKEDDLNRSVTLLEKSVSLLPSGTYKLECSTNKNDRSGSFKFPFVKGGSVAASTTAMSAQSTNPYGIPDHILKQVQDETRFHLLVEGMAEKFNRFMEEWPAYKKKIDTLWSEDDDENGIPDILEKAKQVSDVVQTAKQMKSVFS